MPCSDVGAEGDCEGQGQEPGRRQDEVALIRTSTSEHYQGGADDRSWPELRQLRPTDRSRPRLMEWTHPHFNGVTQCARMKVC